MVFPFTPGPTQPTRALTSPVFRRSLGSPTRAGSWQAGSLGMVWRCLWEQWAPHKCTRLQGAEQEASPEGMGVGVPPAVAQGRLCF